MPDKRNHIPALYQILFKWFCRETIYAELQGDLEEEFHLNVEKYGLVKARNLYRKEVLKMIRASVVKVPSMIVKNPVKLSLLLLNIKLAFRNLFRHKAFSAINVFGLTAALTICLFFVNLIFTGFSLDRQYENLNSLYRVESTVTSKQGDITAMATTPFPSVAMLNEDIPDFDMVCHVRNSAFAIVNVNGIEVELNGLEVDPAFLTLFNLEVLQGDIKDVFNDFESIAITEEVAQRLYPDLYPIGEVTEDGKVIRAIIATPRAHSHMRYEFIGHLNIPISTADTPSFAYSWNAYYDSYTYVLLNGKSDPKALQERLMQFGNKVNRLSGLEQQFSFSIRPVKGIVFSEPVMNEIGTVFGREGLVVFITTILVMLVIACFNYANLSIARAIQRTKEIGVRKVSGSTALQIIGQILIETIFFSLIAPLLAIGLYYYLKDEFIATLPFFADVFKPELSLTIIGVFIFFSVFTGLFAGFFPALYFSRIKALSLFKQGGAKGQLTFLALRKVIITFQLSLSMFTVLFTLLMYQQVAKLAGESQGFETKNRLIVRAESKDAQLLKPAFLTVPGVEAVSQTSGIPGTSINMVESFNELISGDSSIEVQFLLADEAFDEVLEPGLLDGQFFTGKRNSPNKPMLVNRAFLNLLNIDFNRAIGLIIKNKKSSFQIIGIVDDITMGNPFIKTEEAMMIINAEADRSQEVLLLKLEANNLRILTSLEEKWKEILPDYRFEPEYLETYLQKPLTEFLNLVKAEGLLCLAVIAISLLGQVGMALYNAETKVKEIGIRKVLGASLRSIITLLLKGSLAPLIVAIGIGCPLAYFAFINGITPDISSPLKPKPWIFIQGVLGLSTVIILLITSQTWRIAKQNPTESLQAE